MTWYHRFSAPHPRSSSRPLTCPLCRQWLLRRGNGSGFALAGLANPGCRVGTGGAWRTLKTSWMSDLTSMFFARCSACHGWFEGILTRLDQAELAPRSGSTSPGVGGDRTDRRTHRRIDLSELLASFCALVVMERMLESNTR